ncbi:Peptide transporter PTR2 [Zancudomyces culisetae]|uniref:Peptide transporter PTR2 n=1 Tax=Zancudomyces culisetae TaxID=1213189 RepID=A0A1R1PET9_ZANCU|nr:Peptide transporter PTR2 [Zancudomyces culisetae]OMH81230.1 Peptide transporter PTR2 [Zancudomyces culisetae]|eukprot:OMH79476.1 Peptide transporter PTR2 [Zancudomyces culisetae]
MSYEADEKGLDLKGKEGHGLIAEGYVMEQPDDFRAGIPDKLPISAWLIVLTEFCERFTYYGSSLIFTLYLRNILGVSKPKTTAIMKGFVAMCYSMTVLGAFVADQYLGKFKAIIAFGIWYNIGTILLSITAIPSINKSFGFAGFMISSYLFIGIGTGGIKANVSAYVAEQIPVGFKETSVPGTYIDSRATTERVYRYFYWSINMGAFLGMFICPVIRNSNEAKDRYAAAFVVPAALMVLCIVVFVSGKSKYYNKPITGSVMGKVIRCARYALKNKQPGYTHWLDGSKGLQNAEWDDKFVDGLRRSLNACKVFCFYPFYWALYNNMTDNFIYQGVCMQHPSWLEADQLNLVNSVVLIIAIPIMDTFFFPFLRRRGIFMGPIKRIFIGFMIVVSGFVYVTIIQKVVYSTGPYYDFQGDNVPDDPVNDIVIWWQLPAYMIVGISEIFASVTGLEYAFSQAPAELKSLLTALFLFTNFLGSLIGMALAPLSVDPLILWLFAGETVLMFIIGCTVFIFFRHVDEEVKSMQSYD